MPRTASPPDTVAIRATFAGRLSGLLDADAPGITERMDALCAFIGSDRTRIYSWLGERSMPSAAAVAGVAMFYGVSADELLGVPGGR